MGTKKGRETIHLRNKRQKHKLQIQTKMLLNKGDSLDSQKSTLEDEAMAARFSINLTNPMQQILAQSNQSSAVPVSPDGRLD